MGSYVVIGAGGIAQSYPDVVAAAGVKVVRVIDIDLAKAEALAERFGCDASDTLELDGAEAAMVAVPPAGHQYAVSQCIGAGLHVLCEKPLAHRLDVARDMVAEAAAAGGLLVMATKYRTCPDVGAVVDLVRRGALGEIGLVEVAFTSSVDMRGRWNSAPAVSGGGVIMDNGSHAFDLAAFVVGELSEVLVVEGPRPEGLGVEDTVTVHARSLAGAHVSIDLSWSIDKSLPEFLKVFGSEGEARVGWRSASWRRRGGEWTEIGPGYAKVPAMAGVVQAFERAVAGGDPAPLTDGREAALCLDAAYRSLASGAREAVAAW